MGFILDLVLTGCVDPILWLMSMSTLGVRKNRIQCALFFLIFYFMIIGKGIWENYSGGSSVREWASFFILLIVLFATWYLFEGTFYEKMRHLFMFYCILIITETSVIGAYNLLFPWETDGLLNRGMANFICGGLVKLLQAFLCYSVFRRNRTKIPFYLKIEKVSLTLVGFTIVCNLYIKMAVNREKLNITTVLEIMFLCCYIVSLIFILKGKNKHIGELKEKAQNSVGTSKQVSDIDQFRHDFSTNVFMIKNLWYYKDYGKLEHYMDTVFVGTEKVKLLFEHPNFPVRIVVSYLMETAERAGVAFSVQIGINSFGMTDEEICTVFYNIGMNGLEQTSEVPVQNAYVKLEALDNHTGYIIRCKSTFAREENRQQDDRKDSERVAFGMELVERIIKKYGGIVEKKRGKSEWKNISEEEVILQIPYQ